MPAQQSRRLRVAHRHAARQDVVPLSVHAAEAVLDVQVPAVLTHSCQAAIVRAASSGCSTSPQPKSEHCSWVMPTSLRKESLA